MTGSANATPAEPSTGLLAAWWRRLGLLLGLLSASLAGGDEIQVAVASNFARPAQALAKAFETTSGHEVIISTGSTGKHYAQIRHGAPFHLFLAADRERPALLEQDGIARQGSRFTYALGKLVLWGPEPGYVDPRGRILEEGRFSHLAMANPRLAPYGKAAQQVLEARGLWTTLQGRLVRGENIAQAFQFVKSGNAELGLVAWSQVSQPDQAIRGSWWEIPADMYDPIEQQAVLIRPSPAAEAFLAFIRSDAGKGIIRQFGYDTP